VTSHPESSTSASSKEVVRRLYEEVWNGGNIDLVDELVAADCVRHDLRPGNTHGAAGQKAAPNQFRTAFSDVHLDVEALIAEDELVAARWTISAVHTGTWAGVAATGRDVRFSGVNFYRVEDEKIVELWNLRDDYGLREQLGTDGTVWLAEVSSE
jgi:steroid delta-isomerase-like uncharacterized protein